MAPIVQGLLGLQVGAVGEMPAPEGAIAVTVTSIERIV
jgi:transcription elongation GreA/GreB family factor